jgi:hypothetical protein
MRDFSHIGNEALVQSFLQLARHSHELCADLLEYLGEVEARKLYAARGHSSMFAMCTRELGFSEAAAYKRIEVSRLARRHPAILESLRKGLVHLSGLKTLAPHFTRDNCADLLAFAAGKSTRDIERYAASLDPKPSVPDSIRKLPQPRATQSPTTSVTSAAPPTLPLDVVESPALDVLSTAAPATPISHKASVSPLSGSTCLVRFTASQEFSDKLKEAQALLRHSNPEGKLETILEQALDLLLAKVKKDRFGVGAKPRAPKATDGKTSDKGADLTQPEAANEAPRTDDKPKTKQPSVSRHIPAKIRREVFEREGGRCTYESENGVRCGETAWLEYEHLDGFARTQEHVASRMTLRCRAHNDLSAEEMYGKSFMEQARASTRHVASSRPANSPRGEFTQPSLL